MSDTSRMPAEEIATSVDPFELFNSWFEDARKSEPSEPNAMAVATADSAGRPNVRMVLLKLVDRNGFVFYTNVDSAKGTEIAANPQAALLFHWKSLAKQVRVVGPVSRVGDSEADAYFATRPKDSQIGAWASPQSRPMQARWEFEKEVAKFAARYALSKVPRPPYWTGFRVTPLSFEFWRERPFRLHERLSYTRSAPGDSWKAARLYP